MELLVGNEMRSMSSAQIEEALQKGDLSPAKAKKILHDKEVKGHALTDKQRGFMGAVANGEARKSEEPPGEHGEDGNGAEGSPQEEANETPAQEAAEHNGPPTKHDKEMEGYDKERTVEHGAGRVRGTKGQEIKKSDGLDGLRAFLSVDLNKGESAPAEQPVNPISILNEFLSKSEPAMPTGEPKLTGGPQNGGELAGLGKPSETAIGFRPHSGHGPGQDEEGQVTEVPVHTETLAGDDTTEIPGVRKSMTPSGYTPQELAHTVRGAQAAAEATLRKGEPDVQITAGIVEAHPYSLQKSGGDVEDRAEALLKGGFYTGDAPSVAPRNAIINQDVLCKSCRCSHSAMLTSCPNCGGGAIQHSAMPNQFVGGEGYRLEKSLSASMLRPARVEDDLKIG